MWDSYVSIEGHVYLKGFLSNVEDEEVLREVNRTIYVDKKVHLRHTHLINRGLCILVRLSTGIYKLRSREGGKQICNSILSILGSSRL